LEVDEFIIRGTKVHVSVNTPLGAQSATVQIPEIHLKDLGTGPEGITPAELTKKVLNTLFDAAMQEGEKVISDVAKGAQYQTGDVKQIGSNTLDKATKGLGDLLKKK
jgi:hypothetical protein